MNTGFYISRDHYISHSEMEDTMPKGAQVMKTIEISEAAFKILSRWASVGRTIDAAVSCLIDLNTEQSQWTAEELTKLKQSLDEINATCKNEMRKGLIKG